MCPAPPALRDSRERNVECSMNPVIVGPSSLGGRDVRSIAVQHGLPHCIETESPIPYSEEKSTSGAVRNGRTSYLEEKRQCDSGSERVGGAQ